MLTRPQEALHFLLDILKKKKKRQHESLRRRSFTVSNPAENALRKHGHLEAFSLARKRKRSRLYTLPILNWAHFCIPIVPSPPPSHTINLSRSVVNPHISLSPPPCSRTYKPTRDAAAREKPCQSERKISCNTYTPGQSAGAICMWISLVSVCVGVVHVYVSSSDGGAVKCARGAPSSLALNTLSLSLSLFLYLSLSHSVYRSSRTSMSGGRRVAAHLL